MFSNLPGRMKFHFSWNSNRYLLLHCVNQINDPRLRQSFLAFQLPWSKISKWMNSAHILQISLSLCENRKARWDKKQTFFFFFFPLNRESPISCWGIIRAYPSGWQCKKWAETLCTNHQMETKRKEGHRILTVRLFWPLVS